VLASVGNNIKKYKGFIVHIIHICVYFKIKWILNDLNNINIMYLIMSSALMSRLFSLSKDLGWPLLGEGHLLGILRYIIMLQTSKNM
jgi:hypothetical protein